MSQDNLQQRRSWFRFFPEGSLEFVVVTRVLVMLLMLMLMIVTGTQAPFILMALLGMLWLDHMLTLSWTVQLVTDLSTLAEDASPGSGQKPTGIGKTLLIVALPITLAFAAIAPWPEILFPVGTVRGTANSAAKPLLVVASLLSLLPAYRQAKSLQLGPAVWTLAYLLPLLHWLGIHRLLAPLDRRLLSRFRIEPAPEDVGPGTVAAAADVLWIICVLPWLIMAILAFTRGPSASAGMAGRLACVCGVLLFGLYSVVDLAAMEKVQRRFLRLLRSR